MMNLLRQHVQSDGGAIKFRSMTRVRLHNLACRTVPQPNRAERRKGKTLQANIDIMQAFVIISRMISGGLTRLS